MSAANASVLFKIADLNQIGAARRCMQAMAAECGFDETESGRAGIVITEAATNLIKHAGGGELLLRRLDEGGRPGLEMLALDKGPGITVLDHAFEDGYSTAGSPGTGLGAMRRLSTRFDMYSQPGKGTAALAQIWKEPSASVRQAAPVTGAISLPLAGESVCGDGWSLRVTGNTICAMVADGLGHGLLAAEASQRALEVFNEHPALSCVELIHLAHKALLSTRGAALAVIELDRERGVLRLCGVGNIACGVHDGGRSRGLASHNGIVGHQMHKTQEMSVPCPRGALIILYSDGLGNRWKLEDYPGLSHRHPALAAGVLYRDHARGRDDVTVLAIRDREA